MRQLFVPFIVIASWVLPATSVEIHVAPNGNDAWSGTIPQPNAEPADGPVATLEGARDAVRRARAAGDASAVAVYVHEGDYVREGTFELTPEDGGTAEAPVVYRSVDGQASPRLLGGTIISGFNKISEQSVLERLAPEARDHIVAADLAGQGIADFGEIKRRGFGLPGVPVALELYFAGAPMTLARWPNDDWTTIASVPENTEGVFVYEGARPDQWASLEDIWIHGYWTWDWAESYEKIAKLDRETKQIRTVAPHGVYGYKAGKRFYFLNVLEELDSPGEYYVDRATGTLYFWPPAPVESAEAAVSVLEGPFVSLTDTAHVTIQGVTFMFSRGPGLSLSGGNHNSISMCTFANLGTSAVSVSGGTHNRVTGCEMHNLNYGGISLSGGDRATLTPGDNSAVNNHIHHFSRISRTYTPAVQVNGVGNRVANNLIHDAPHMAIGLAGNDHIIELNEIHHVCMETSDAGAFYMGRDWTQRGNVIRYNFFHELGHGDVQAVYLDDWTSGTTVFGNICHGALRGVLVGGGRDNRIENNIFVDCKIGVHIDQRGIGWAKYYFDGTTTTLFDRLNDVNGTAPPYTDRYPELATLLEDEPALAKNNVVLRNISIGGNWLNLSDNLTPETPYLTIKHNLVDVDPHFVAPESLNFELRSDSPAYALGFQRLPWQEIGLLKKATSPSHE